jgi:hypothetical protein
MVKIVIIVNASIRFKLSLPPSDRYVLVDLLPVFRRPSPYANDLDNLGHFYSEYIRLAKHWRAALPATTLPEIPYDALIEDQEGWTRRMLDFIGLPWDPKCLDFHQTDRVVITFGSLCH